MKRKLLSNLAASWIVSPIWAVMVTAFGLGSHDGILTILYVATITIPFQLLLNDCIGVGNAVRDEHRLEWRVLLILSAQWMTTLVAIAVTTNRFGIHAAIWCLLAASAATVGNTLSFRTTTRYYSALRGQRITTQQSMLLGMIPGISTLAYSIPFIASTRLAGINSTITSWIALGFIIVGPLAQHIFTVRKIPAAGVNPRCPKQVALAKVSFSLLKPLLLIGIAITALSGAAVWARDEISGDLGNTAVLGITALNLVGTVINTLTRASNLENPSRRYWPLLAIAGALTAAVAALLAPTLHTLSLICFCLCFQIFLAALIEFSRRALGWGSIST